MQNWKSFTPDEMRNAESQVQLFGKIFFRFQQKQVERFLWLGEHFTKQIQLQQRFASSSKFCKQCQSIYSDISIIMRHDLKRWKTKSMRMFTKYVLRTPFLKLKKDGLHLQDINTWELHCKAAATHRGNVAQHARIVKVAPGNHMAD